MEPEELVEYRYRAVCEVLGGLPIGEVAVRDGMSMVTIARGPTQVSTCVAGTPGCEARRKARESLIRLWATG